MVVGETCHLCTPQNRQKTEKDREEPGGAWESRGCLAWGWQPWRLSTVRWGQCADGWGMGSERGGKEKQCLLQVFGSCERMTYGCTESGLGGKGRPALNSSPRQTPGLTSDSRAPFGLVGPRRIPEDLVLVEVVKLAPSRSSVSRLNSGCVPWSPWLSVLARRPSFS